MSVFEAERFPLVIPSTSFVRLQNSIYIHNSTTSENYPQSDWDFLEQEGLLNSFLDLMEVNPTEGDLGLFRRIRNRVAFYASSQEFQIPIDPKIRNRTVKLFLDQNPTFQGFTDPYLVLSGTSLSTFS